MEQGAREKEFKFPPSEAQGIRWTAIELRRRRRTLGGSSIPLEIMVEDEVLEENADSMASSSWSCSCVIGSSQSHSGTEKRGGDGEE